MRRLSGAVLAAALGLAACSVSESRDENGARTVDIKTDVGGVKADIDTSRGGNISIDGDAARVDVGNGAVHATMRTDQNRSITVTTNQQ